MPPIVIALGVEEPGQKLVAIPVRFGTAFWPETSVPIEVAADNVSRRCYL